jgi:hypothetical protein
MVIVRKERRSLENKPKINPRSKEEHFRSKEKHSIC